MRHAAAALLLLAGATSGPALAQLDAPWLKYWLPANAPHGFDVTLDGTMWINLAEPGLEDDYAIRAEDLHKARSERSKYPTFWVRGYHKRNPKVAYRESKTRMYLDCDRQTLGTSLTAYYGPGGKFLWQTGASSSDHVIPGTYGAEYHRLFCLVTD